VCIFWPPGEALERRREAVSSRRPLSVASLIAVARFA
jgi:hypothetical protein